MRPTPCARSHPLDSAVLSLCPSLDSSLWRSFPPPLSLSLSVSLSVCLCACLTAVTVHCLCVCVSCTCCMWRRRRRRKISCRQLSGQSSWWKNPCRGGNRNGDFAQVYVECRPGSFKQRKEALLRSRPGLVERAMQNWMDAWAHGTLDNLASLPPEDPPGPATRKRVRKNHLQLDGEQTAIKKCKECDATSAQHLLPRKQQASNVSNAPEAASATAFTSIFAPQLV